MRMLLCGELKILLQLLALQAIRGILDISLVLQNFTFLHIQMLHKGHLWKEESEHKAME